MACIVRNLFILVVRKQERLLPSVVCEV